MAIDTIAARNKRIKELEAQVAELERLKKQFHLALCLRCDLGGDEECNCLGPKLEAAESALAEKAEAIESWKSWHRDIAGLLGLDFVSRQATMERVSAWCEDRQAAEAEVERLKAEGYQNGLAWAEACTRHADTETALIERAEAAEAEIERLRETVGRQGKAIYRISVDESAARIELETAVRERDEARAEIERLRLARADEVWTGEWREMLDRTKAAEARVEAGEPTPVPDSQSRD